MSKEKVVKFKINRQVAIPQGGFAQNAKEYRENGEDLNNVTPGENDMMVRPV